MGFFDLFQGLIGGAGDLAQGSVGDIIGGVVDNPLQDLQDQATNLANGATEAVNSVTEQGQATVEGITQDLGL
jgi:hypothetical protein